jgi:hypothetical protein
MNISAFYFETLDTPGTTRFTAWSNPGHPGNVGLNDGAAAINGVAQDAKSFD